MPFRICKTFTVENGHMLSKHPGKCRYPHGHSRRIEVVLEADRLDRNDMVCDFKRLKEALQAFIEKFDHSLCVNTADPHYAFYRDAYSRVVPFENADPTSELMARMIFEEAKEAFPQTGSGSDGVRVVRVRIHETETSWAEYEP